MRPTYSVDLVTAPAEEPVSLAEAKAHLQVEHSAHDDYITGLIASARDATEREARLYWVTQTVEVAFSGWPRPCDGPVIEMPVSPLSAVTAVEYTDANGATQTMESGDWQVWANHRPPLVAPAAGSTSWPSVQSGALAPIRMTVTVGFGGADTVPPLAKQAIKICLGAWYQGNRGELNEPPQAVAARVGIPNAAVNLLALIRHLTYP